MIVQQKLGSLSTLFIDNRAIDWLPIEWFEANKRILHKKTMSGKEFVLKFLKSGPALTQDDVLYEDEEYVVAIDIVPCDTIVIWPATLYEMASVCYEIGNKHLPVFYDNDTVLVPFEAPLFRLLETLGFNTKRENRKLLHALKTTVAPHPHRGNESFFSKIMQLTSTPDA